MSREEFETALAAHAEALETAVALASNRVDHIRATAQALEARRLVEIFRAAGASAAA